MIRHITVDMHCVMCKEDYVKGFRGPLQVRRDITDEHEIAELVINIQVWKENPLNDRRNIGSKVSLCDRCYGKLIREAVVKWYGKEAQP